MPVWECELCSSPLPANHCFLMKYKLPNLINKLQKGGKLHKIWDERHKVTKACEMKVVCGRLDAGRGGALSLASDSLGRIFTAILIKHRGVDQESVFVLD